MFLYTYTFEYKPKTNSVHMIKKTTEVVETDLMYRAVGGSREDSFIYKYTSRIYKSITEKVVQERYEKYKFTIITKKDDFEYVKDMALVYINSEINKRENQIQILNLMSTKIINFND